MSIEYSNLHLSINISDLQKLSDLNQTDIKKLRESNYFIKMISQFACELITFNLSQSNIAGIDLFMDMNIHKKSGFTGTPNISKFYDLDINQEVQVNQVNLETQKLIKSSLLNSSFSKMDYDESQISYLEKIIESNIKNKILPHDEYYCNTLIDVGAICVGINVEKIYEIVKKYNTSLKQFIYWNKEDIPYCIDNYGKNFVWNKIISNNNEMFYYYDNKHTTGIDAVIPMKSIGLVLLGKNSRYRDVVQGIYRMRKLNIDNGHKIHFILNNKLYDYITKLFAIPDINIGQLIKWFDIEEEKFNDIQQNIMSVQNVRSLRRYFYSEDKKNIFNIDNAFKYPDPLLRVELTTDLIMGIKTYTNIEILNKIEEIMTDTTKDKSNIINFLQCTQKKLKTINITNNNSVSISQNESQEQSQTQEQSQNLQLSIEENMINDSLLTEAPVLRYLDTFDKYFMKGEYYKKIYDNVIKAYISKNLKLFSSGPYFILYMNKTYFMIPFIEGIKLLENIPELKCMIFDTENVVYYNNLDNNLNVLLIGKVLFKKILDTIYLDEEDYVSIAKMKNKEIFEYIKNTNSKTHKFNEFKLILDDIYKLKFTEIELIRYYNQNREKRSSIYKDSTGNFKIILNFFTANGVSLKTINMVGGSNIKINGYKIINKYDNKKNFVP